jgi:hypothetical protein
MSAGFLPPSGRHDPSCEFLCSNPSASCRHACSVCDSKRVGHLDETVCASGPLNPCAPISFLRIARSPVFTLDAPRDGGREIELSPGTLKRIECIESDGSSALVRIGESAPGELSQAIFNREGQMMLLEWTEAGWRVNAVARSGGIETPRLLS